MIKSISEYRKLLLKYKYIVFISLASLLLIIWFFLLSNFREVVVNNEIGFQESNLNQASSEVLDKIDCTGSWSDSPLCRERSEALAEIKKFTELNEELVSLNVNQWANVRYTDFLNQATKADQFFNTEYYGKSAETYSEINNGLSILIIESSEILENYITSGLNFLLQNNSSDATKEFKKALAIEENNFQAKEGIYRASVLDNLLSKISEIKILIEINDLNLASILMEEVLQLDNQNIEAKELNLKLQKLLKELEFDKAITSGYLNIDNGNFKQALEFFQQAFALDAKSQAAISGIFEAEQGIKRNRIFELGEKAKGFEIEEEWQSVVEVYNQVLSIDNNIEFAKEGIVKAENYIQLHTELDRLLSEPKRLTSVDVAYEANNLISDSEEFRLGPRLQSKINSLILILGKYSKKVKLKMISDGRSNISIQKAGSLGRFKTKELELSPGKYTFIAKRRGYQTVRKTVEIERNSTLELICFQKI